MDRFGTLDVVFNNAAVARFTPIETTTREAIDQSGLAAFLASSDADYMTGQCINVDGGMVFD